jgi:ubiquinone/menaquinone biosynthesis C-methylase UbiE
MWSDIPRLRQRWNVLVSVDADSDHIDHFHRKYIAGRTGLHGLSLGCGNGAAVFRWLEKGGFAHILGIDITRSQIEAATETSRQKNVEHAARFCAADVHTLDFSPHSIDCIFFDHAMHHFVRLDRLLPRIDTWLKPDGVLILSEYVGPRRFQWTHRQMSAGNKLLRMLPPRLRTWHDSGRVKNSIVRASQLRMYLGDPSEAIESDRIVPLLNQTFQPIELRPCGNTLMHPVLHGIAHHFCNNDAEAAEYLDQLIEGEDRRLASRQIESDFLVAIFGKQTRRSSATSVAGAKTRSIDVQ